MASATLNLNVTPKRMLRKAEAAHHCGLGAKQFVADCPVRPVRFPSGAELFDVRDLDAWIDSLKAGSGDVDDDILGRLE